MKLLWSGESSACRWTCEGDMFAIVKQKSCLLFEERNVEVTVSLWFWLFRGEALMSPKNVAQR